MRLRICLIALLAGVSLHAQVSFDRVLHGDREPHNWLSYSGTLLNQRYSPLTQITPANVKNLQQQWIWQARSLEKFEATPLVVDGIMYTVEAPNNVVALDAVTGRPFWTFTYTPAPEGRPCCGRVNRGVAILGDTLFMGTIDAHLIAIDAKSGKQIWNTVVANAADRYSITHSPTVVKDKVIIGTGGGDGPIRGFIAAFDAKTGKEAWRFYTIPGPGEPGNETWSGESWKTGGVGVWNVGAYDAETNLVFFGTGNPAPDWDGSKRIGDNLYSDSVVAINADTGKLKWHYQFTPHDELDYDATQVPVLADIEWQGRPRKVMLWANRNGVMYVLDRTTGEFLKGKPYVKTNWLDGFDSKGRPNRVKFPTPEGTLIQPHVHGATNWAPPSFSPRTGLFYVATWEDSGTVAVAGGFPRAANTGQTAMGQTNLVPFYNKDDEAHGVVRAYDPKTLDTKWEFRMTDITWGGVLSTATDLVFSGGRDGYFFALDGRTGGLLWKTTVGGQVNAGAMSYSVNGKQYVAIAAGNSVFAFALPDVAGPFTGFPREAADFFRLLEKNNNREWFLAHKDVYERACREPMKDLVAELEPRFGPGKIPRINRDLRFSANRSPYKTHIAAGVGGRYINLSREGLWVGGGMYKPEPAVLRRFRASIDDDVSGRQLATIVSSLRRKGYDVDTHDTVTSAPKGYRADHPRIDLLRMKDIFAGKALPTEAWLSSRKAFDRIVKAMDDVEPLTKWLRQHVR